MHTKFELLSPEIVQRITDESLQLLLSTGVKVHAAEARNLLAEAGASVDETEQVAKIPESVARQALESAPSHFNLYNRAGEAAVTYGGDVVQFDPGSSGVNILDPETLEHKPSYRDLQ